MTFLLTGLFLLPFLLRRYTLLITFTLSLVEGVGSARALLVFVIFFSLR